MSFPDVIFSISLDISGAKAFEIKRELETPLTGGKNVQQGKFSF